MIVFKDKLYLAVCVAIDLSSGTFSFFAEPIKNYFFQTGFSLNS